MIIPAGALGRAGRPSPAERVTMGIIGCGGMGMANMGSFLGHPDCQVVAVCDVDARRRTKLSTQPYGREPAKEEVEKKYSEDMKGGRFKGCDVYADFRELCARKDIQAVVVATPDHWHALASLEALRNGKDVYCEKPVVHHFAEGLVVLEEVKKRNAIWQTGSQQRSEWNFRHGAELVRNGHIGKVLYVEVGLPKGHLKPIGDAEEQAPPEGFDYDFWCGPSKKLPFIPARVHFNWRWNLNYGGGQLMDWIGHHNDIAHWGLDMDHSGPVEAQAVGFDWSEIPEIYDAPVNYEVKCTYASGVTTSISNKHAMGTRWIGTNGWVFVDRGKQESSVLEWFDKKFDPGPVKLYESNDHRGNFLNGVKSRKTCICPVETALRSITPGFLGYISQKLGRKVKWDPAGMKFVDDPEATKLLEIKYREPWKL
jgi:predicted dehydrogenase